MGRVRVVNVVKRFGKVVAVDHATFTVENGEFFALLGPSGSGKTTLLRIIAGLEEPDEGEIWIDDMNVTKLHPKDRDVAMVFQNYALYPHMSVYENIAFPLMVKKRSLGLSNEEIRRRVHEIAKLLNIEELLERKPSQLSGGQQQRVALARALIRKPKVWLLDEPLSNLDAKLRVYMRAELKRLQKDLGITTIYVTHDQIEAMTMADRIAVINQGKIQQIGSPDELYNKPINTFVATFIGSPPMNLVKCRVDKDYTKLICFDVVKELDPSITKILREKLGTDAIYIGVRPEHIKVSKEKTDPDMIRGKIVVYEKIGSEQILHVSLDEENIIRVRSDPTKIYSFGEEVYVKIDWSKTLLFDPKTNELLI
ncbi:MAG: ABC transporter ATP-binding protein [Sulfolobales archaeon]